MKLKKILEDIHIPLKKGDTVLVGKFKNHPITVKSIGKGDDGMPTINGKPAVKFRFPKKVKDEGLEQRKGYKSKQIAQNAELHVDPKRGTHVHDLTEMPHGHGDYGEFDLQIEKYPLPDHQKKALLQAYNSDTGVWGYSKKYDTIVIFKRTGVMISPKGGVAQTEPATSAKPQSLDGGVPGGNNSNKLPPEWERFIIGKY